MPSPNKNKPRILIVENGVAVTGSVISILRSSVRLGEYFEFIFLFPSGSAAAPILRAQGFAVFEIPMRELKKDFFSLIAYVPALAFNALRFLRIIKRQRIQLIHSNDFYNLLAPVYRIAGGRIPYIVHMRFMPSRFPASYLAALCTIHRRNASAILTVSQAAKQELKKIESVVVIADGLPLQEIAYSNPSSNVILYPANFTRGKGQDYAVQVFANISKKFPEWKLRFVGGTLALRKNQLYKNELIRLADELGITDRVEWKEFSEDIGREYEQAAIVLNFSDSESFSLTCQESLYFGRPVVATDSGGPSAIVEDRHTGLVVPKQDLLSMQLALEQLMGDAVLREKMGRKGMVRMKQLFGPAMTSDLLRSVYLEALRNHDGKVE
ncbi:MAG TPA: glycosyltransferase [Cyclobacteriaceae bacterium]|nr:glycosyltransferase [Cyclobacteriaceae bacterium]